MDKFTRRALLRTLAKGAFSAVGTVVLARASLADPSGTPAIDTKHTDVQARAAELERGDLGLPNETYAQFRNAFRNGGRFRNGGFRNGGFRNGGFRNGGFRNGGFRNGGGGFRNRFRNR
jgi:rSAM-associated Gly-rich repeat protein